MKREFTYTVTKEDVTEGLSVKKLMDRNFSFSSRLRAKIKKHRTVYLNGKDVPVYIKPAAGDTITVRLPEEKSWFPPEDIPLEVLYEDEDLLIINKQPYITVHPTNGQPNHTIANAAAKYMIDTGQSFKIRFINRLDMDTSGVLALGKNSFAQDQFVKQAQSGGVHKGYLAVVDHIIEDETGTIDAPIGHLPDDIRRGVMENGQPSVTHYEVVERFYPKAEDDIGFTLVRLKLETGRTHQIRVHMAFIGHPVTGDPLYGGSSHLPGTGEFLIGRQALHAEILAFDHPATGKPLEIRAPLPEDMRELIQKIGR